MRMIAPTRTPRRRRDGFTLIELTMVVLIAGIIATIGIFRLGRGSVFISESQQAAKRLVADLRYAQSLAITHAKNHYLLFNDNGAKLTFYAIYRVEDGDDVQVDSTRLLPDSVALTGDAQAEFTPEGSALGNYAYELISPGTDYDISVVLATGAVQWTEP